jgi:peptide/nickel transport system permease protein
MAEDAVVAPISVPVRRVPGADIRRRMRIPLAVGVFLVAVIVLAAIFAPLIAPHPPNQQDLLHALEPPGSAGHPLGTDQFGRDVLARVVYAARIDLLIAVGATVVTLCFGTAVGLISGTLGGRVDSVIMRIVDVFFAFPLIVLVLAIVAILGSGLGNMFIAMWAVTWVPYARIVRAEALVIKQQEYITAARALGFSRRRTMVRHILPNAAAPALVYAMIDAVNNVSIGASLGFLGLGVRAPTAEWGNMIADSQQFIRTAWWLAAVPGIAIALFGLGLSLIGDRVADRMRGGRNG